MKPLIAIINESKAVSDADVQMWMAAAQYQVSNDFAPIWDAGAQLEYVPGGTSVPAGTWQLVFLDDSDQANALGYHELTANGDPLGKAFVGSDVADGVAWSVTASHELLEMLGDPPDQPHDRGEPSRAGRSTSTPWRWLMRARLTALVTRSMTF